MASDRRLMMMNGPGSGSAADEEPETIALSGADASAGQADVLALVEAACAGNERAFEVVMSRYQASVRAYLAHLIGDDDQARDLTQDTFWQAWRAMPRLRDPALFRPWLFRIATNRARSWLRHKRLIGWVSLDWLTSQKDDERTPPASAASPGVAFHAPESGFEERVVESETLRQALAQVPAEYRSCLLLHLSLGFTVSEVAEQLGLTRGAVRMRLYRGLALLREAYRQPNH